MLRPKRSVSIRPGLIAFTRTPSLTPISAIALVKFSNATLTEPPMVNSAEPAREPMPTMLTMQPSLLAQMRPCGARRADIAVEFQCEAVLPVVLGEGEEVGALGGAGIVDQDIEPAERRDRRIDRGLAGGGFAQIAGDDGWSRLLPEMAAMPLATSSSFALSRAARQTCTPSRASSAAIDAPMPRLAPVTSATLPLRFRSMLFPSRYTVHARSEANLRSCPRTRGRSTASLRSVRRLPRRFAPRNDS